jgi:dTMP kinase
VSAPPGRFVAIEGIDGSGKSTQAARLVDALGPTALLTREPGGTPLGERLRSLWLWPGDGVDVGDRAEVLMLAAARAQHVEEVVRPALAAGRLVVSDRYAASSLAYQGAGRGLGVEAVRAVNHWATDGLWPDLTVLVRLPVDTAWQRLRAGRGDDGVDRLERSGRDFMARVAGCFDELAAASAGGPWAVVDGDRDADAVAASVLEAVLAAR